MKAVKKYLGIIMVVVLFIGLIVFQTRKETRRQENRTYQVSYIYRNHSFVEEGQLAIRQGIERRGKENRCEITAVPYESAISAELLGELMRKEKEKGADALLLEAANDGDIQNVIRELGKELPIIQMNEREEVCIDFRQMGRELALRAVKEKMPDTKIYIIPGDERFEDVALTMQGAEEALNECGEPYERTNMLDLNDQEEQVILTFDLTDLESCAKNKKEKTGFQNSALYGLGKTNQMIAYLEEGDIEALGVFDEYSMGYVAAGAVVEKLHIKGKGSKNSGAEEPRINYAIISKDQIYSTENQRLLFPFVQ